MLEAVFAKILQMSLMGCYSIGITLAVRLLLIRCGRKYAYYLWALIFVCLCLPVSLPGNYSLIPRQVAEFSLLDFADSQSALPETGEGSVIHELAADGLAVEEPYLLEEWPGPPWYGGEDEDLWPGPPWYDREKEALPSEIPTKDDSRGRLQGAARVWLLGVLLLTGGILGSICRMSLRCANYSRCGHREEKGIVEAEGVSFPFLWGFFRPNIYLPTGLGREERTYILMHEMVHRKRRDHLVQFLILAAVVLHWFNPLVWLAYGLCGRDMEISCDEAVLENSGEHIRKAYAESLLKYAARQNRYIVSPLGFGEPSVKSRIRNILHYRKKSVWITTAAGLCVMGIAIGFLHYPTGKEDTDQGSISDRNVTETELLPEGEPLSIDEDEGRVVNNGGEILSVNGEVYDLPGSALYSDGEALYLSVTGEDGSGHVRRYELDGSSSEWVLEGRIVDSVESGKTLYCMYQTEEGSECLGWYDTRTRSSGRFSQEGAAYLGRNGGFLYTAVQEADGLHLNRIREIDQVEEMDLLGAGIPAEEILMIHGEAGGCCLSGLGI